MTLPESADCTGKAPTTSPILALFLEGNSVLRKLSAFLGSTAAVGALVLFPGTVSAGQQDPSQAPCGQGTTAFCWWSEANFGGNGYVMADLESGMCYSMPEGLASTRSFHNYGTSEEGWFYSAAGCTGDSSPVAANTESPDLGFPAMSFYSTCVSCQRPHQR